MGSVFNDHAYKWDTVFEMGSDYATGTEVRLDPLRPTVQGLLVHSGPEVRVATSDGMPVDGTVAYEFVAVLPAYNFVCCTKTCAKS